MATPDFLLEVGIDYAPSLQAFEEGLTKIVGELSKKENKIKIMPDLNSSDFKQFQSNVVNALNGIAGAARFSIETLNDLYKAVSNISKQDFSMKFDVSKAFDQSDDIAKYRAQVKDYVKLIKDARQQIEDSMAATGHDKDKGSIAQYYKINVAPYYSAIAQITEKLPALERRLNLKNNLGNLVNVANDAKDLIAPFKELMEQLNALGEFEVRNVYGDIRASGKFDFDLDTLLNAPEAPVTTAKKMSDTLTDVGSLLGKLMQTQGQVSQSVVKTSGELKEESKVIESVSKASETHVTTMSEASKAEQEKLEISKQLAEALQKENEALKLGEDVNWFQGIADAVNGIRTAVESIEKVASALGEVDGAGGRAAEKIRSISRAAEQAEMGRFTAQLETAQNKFEALGEKPKKLTENMAALQEAEAALMAAEDPKDQYLALQQFSSILQVVRDQITAQSSSEKNASSASREYAKAINDLGKEFDQVVKIYNQFNNGALKSTFDSLKIDFDQIKNKPEELTRNMSNLEKAWNDLQGAFDDGDLYKIRDAFDDWKIALNGVRAAMAPAKKSQSIANKEDVLAQKEAAQQAAAAFKNLQELQSKISSAVLKRNSLTFGDTDEYTRLTEKLRELDIEYKQFLKNNKEKLSDDQFARLNAGWKDLREKIASADNALNKYTEDLKRKDAAATNKSAAKEEAEDYKKLLDVIKEIGKARSGKQKSLFAGDNQSVELENKNLQEALQKYRAYYNLLKDNLTADQQRRITEEFQKQNKELERLRSNQENRQEKAETKQAEKDAAAAEREIERLAKLREEINAINLQMQSGVITEQLDSLYNKLNLLSDGAPQLEEHLARIIDCFQILNDPSATDQQRADAMAEYTRLTKEANSALDALLEKEGKDAKTQDARKAAYKELSKALLDIEKMKQRVANGFQGKNSQTYQDLVALENEANRLRDSLGNMGSADINSALDGFNASLERAKLDAEGLSGSIRNMDNPLSMLESRLTSMISLGALIMKAVQQIKKMVTETVNLDTAMTQLRVVTNNSEEDYREYGNAVADIAQKIGASISDLVDSTTVFARLGYSLSESKELARTTAMLANVGDIDISSAQTAVTTMTKAFADVDAGNIESTMDKLVEIGNNFPISVSEIASGIDNAGSALSAAGNRFDESVALLTSANTAVQNISKASTGLRTIAARIRRTTFELDELGEKIEEAKYQKALDILTGKGVKLTENGEYRSTYEIIKNIAEVWHDLSSMDQAAIAEQLAGTRQQNVFFSLVEQFNEAEKAMQSMENSSGSLQNAYDEYSNSIQRHIDSFKAAFTSLSTTVIDSGLVKGIVDTGTNFITILDKAFNLLNKIGGILPIILGVSSNLIFNNWGKIKDMTGISKAAQWFKLLDDNLTKAAASSKTFGEYFGKSMKSIGAAIGPGGIISLTIAALTALISIINKVQQSRIDTQKEIYTSKSESAKESGDVYELYAAYMDVIEAQDNTAESKARVEEAAKALAAALGIEEDAIIQLQSSYRNLTVEQLKAAAADAKIAKDAAEKAAVWNLDKRDNQATKTYLARYAGSVGINITSGSDEERAASLLRLYDKLIEEQRELAQQGKTDSTRYSYVSKSIEFLRQDMQALSEATHLYGETQEHLNDVMRGTTDPAKKLGKALSQLTNRDMRSLLTGEWYSDEQLEHVKEVMSQYYGSAESMRDAMLSNQRVVLERVSQPLQQAKAQYEYLQQQVAQKGIDVSKTVFGNIDLNNRQLLHWTSDAVAEFESELESWGRTADDMVGHVSTVLGGSNEYGGVEIAFSPILQTDDGPKLLSAETVDSYILELIGELNEAKEEWTTEDLLELDARGIEKDGKKISKIIADVGETAKDTGEAMHYLGEDGALSLAAKNIENAQKYLDQFTGISADGITDSTKDAIADLASFRDELEKTNQALEDYKKAMEGGEKDDAIKQAAEIYKGALEDIKTGKIDSNRMNAAAELFFSQDWLNARNWDMKAVAETLQNSMWQYLFDPEEKYDLDFGQRFAEYVRAAFTKVNGVWMEGNNFFYNSVEDVARAFDMSTEAASMFLSALDMYGVNTMRSVEENKKLVDSFYDLKDQLGSANAAVRQMVEEMSKDGMNSAQIHAVLNDLQQSGIINLNQTELHQIISDVLGTLDDVNKENIEPSLSLDTELFYSGINSAYEAMNDFVTNNSNGWTITPGLDLSKVNGTIEIGDGVQSSGTSGGAVNISRIGNSPIFPSHAGGKRPSQNGGETLVNELGPELISDNGRAYIANGGKPGFTFLSEDAIVFTAEETKEILNGRQNVKAKSRAIGTGHAGLMARLLSGRSTDARAKSITVSQKMCPKCLNYIAAGLQTCPYCGQHFGGTYSQRMEQQTATRVYYDDDRDRSGTPVRTSVVTTAMAPGTTVETLEFRDGNIVINGDAQEIKSTVQPKEELYYGGQRSNRNYYDPAQEVNDKKKLAGDGRGGAGVGGANSQSESNPEKIDWIAVRINRLQRTIADLEKIASSGFKKLDTRLDHTKLQIQEITKELKDQENAYYRYMAEADSVGLSADLADKVKFGAIDISEYDADTRQMIQEYQEWYEKALDAKSEVENLHQDIAQLYVDAFDNVQADFENQLKQLEHSSAMVQKNLDLSQAKGYLDSAQFYEQLASNQTTTINQLNVELEQLQSKFTEAMNSGEIEETSEAWYQMKNSINEVEEAIADANIQLVEYQRTIRSIEWDYFDYAQDRFSKMTEEANFLVDLMSHHELFNDNGQFNNLGAATAGMHAVDYDVYMTQAEEYAKEIQKIQRELEKDPYDTQLIERREALISLQRQSIQAAESEKEAIKSLVSEGINKELEALKKLIDTYNDSLSSAKDLYEYQKKVTEKTQDIASLQKQLSAYTNDTSEETRAKVQKLNKDLKDAQKELQETEWDRNISDQKKLLDDLYEDYSDLLNERLDNIDLLMQEIIAGTNENMDSIRNTLVDVGDEVGYTITEAMMGVLHGDLGYFDHEFDGIHSVQLTLTGIYDMVSAMARASGAVKAYATGGLVDYTGLAAVHGSKGRPELMLNASDTENFLEAARMMRSLYTAPDLATLSHAGIGGGMSIGQIQVNIPIDRVLDYNDLISQMRDDPKFERLIGAMTLDRAVGKSSFGKNKIVF